jgi:hypothetical protein
MRRTAVRTHHTTTRVYKGTASEMGHQLDMSAVDRTTDGGWVRINANRTDLEDNDDSAISRIC